MTLDSWLIYVATVLAMMVTPGPSHLLMLSNSVSNGFRRSLATAAGDLSANILQMLAAGFGLAAILSSFGNALTIIKCLGAVYLIWLGLNMIRKANGAQTTAETLQRVPLKNLWFQGFITSSSNPKAIVFFAALFPLFIDPNLDFATQFIILSVTYILIDGAFLATYGAGASAITQKFKDAGRKRIHQFGGSLMIVAAVLLGLKSS